MKFAIGAHRNSNLHGKYAWEIYGGIWDTIEASDANEAAKVFLLRYNEVLFKIREWRLYEVRCDLSVGLFEYCIVEWDCDDPILAL